MASAISKRLKPFDSSEGLTEGGKRFLIAFINR